MNNKQLYDNYAKGLSSRGNLRNLYLRHANEFLEYAEGVFDKEKILAYLEHLKRKHKYSDGTINFAFRIIRTLFSRSENELKEAGFEWSFRRGEAPQIRESTIEAPALDPGVIVEMIEAAKEKGKPDEAAFLALSTTYGLRRIEMVELSQEDVRLKDKSIHIATAKHGRERTHLIPPEIIPCFKNYDFSTEISESGLFTLWYRLEYMIKLPHTKQVGFHSIRRTLNTLLMDSLPEHTVMSFLRWKQRTSSHMPYRYSAQKFVGREESSTLVVGEAKSVDEKVFEVHPFIKYWK